MIENIVSFLRGWQHFTRAVEALLIDNIVATAPWLALIIPAFMCWHSMNTILDFPAWMSWAGAGVVELLGLSAVSTSFQFWDYNDSRRKLDQRAPTRLAALTTVFYLAVVLCVNVMLDNAPVMYKLAKALLSTLTICAAIVLALRSQHSRRLENIAQEKAERRAERLDRKITENSGKFPATTLRPDFRQLPMAEYDTLLYMTPRKMVERYGISDRTARNWRKYLQGNNGHKKEVEEFNS